LGLSCLLVAILSHLGGILGPRASKMALAAWDCAMASPFLPISGSIFKCEIDCVFVFLIHFLEQFLDTFWITFRIILGTHSGTKAAQEGPRWAQRGPRRPSKYFFLLFGGPRPSKTASRGPKRLPRGTQRTPKPQIKRIQTLTHYLPIFGQSFGNFGGRGQNRLREGTKNGTSSGTL
jgi:hypothetical protein